MGRQKGLLHLTGQYGDVQLSINANGSPIAKLASRTSRKKVKKASNYALTRKNNDEFTGSAYAAHSLRTCMGERIRQFADRALSNRLFKVTYGVIALGPGMAGQRSFEVGANANAFMRLDANKNEPLTGRIQAPYTVTVNPDRNTVTLDMPPFATDNFLYRPQGATHFRLLLVAGVLSDHVYTGNNQVYAPANPTIDKANTTVLSQVFPAVSAVNAAVQLTATIPGTPILPSSACLVVSLGIEFLRVVNNYEEVMASGNALRVIAVA